MAKNAVVESLTKTLVKIIDGRDKEVNKEYHDAALLDLLKLLFMFYNRFAGTQYASTQTLINYNQHFFNAINNVHRQIQKKDRVLDIKNSIFRDFLVVLFTALDKEEDLKKVNPTWTKKMLLQDRATMDMKLLFMSVKEIVEEQEVNKNKEELEKKVKEEAENKIEENKESQEVESENKD